MGKVKVTSQSDGPPNRKKHRLIKEIRPGKVILEHPLIYQIKKGDNLSTISRSIAGGKVSVSDIRRWNTYLTDDTIHPGKALWLADPNDELVKAVSGRFGEQTQRKHPEIDLERLGRELADKYAGVMARQYKVQIQLQFDEAGENIFKPAFFGGSGNSNGFNGPLASGQAPKPGSGSPSIADQLFPYGSGSGYGQPGFFGDSPWQDRGPWIGPKYDPLEPIIGGFGAVSRFVGSVGLAFDGTSLGLENWIKHRPDRLLHGQAQLHPRYMDLSDDAYVYANRFLSGRNTLNLAKFTKVAGPVATLVGLGFSVYNLSTENGSGWDVADIGVNAVGLAVAILPYMGTAAATFAAANPVGLTIVGVVVLGYNGFRIYQAFTED